MTTIADAFNALKARAVSVLTGQTLLFPDAANVLPDTPATFIYFEMITEGGEFIEIGGGRGANRHRTAAELHAYVFVPRGQGLAVALAAAEPVAAAFRSFRGSGVSCNGATIHPAGEGAQLVPPGGSPVAGNYSAVVVAIPFTFDQVG